MSNEAIARGGDETRGARGQALTLLRDRGRLTRMEIARGTGLSPTTITRIVAQLLDDGFVAEGATVVRRRTGRRGTQLALVPEACGVVGVQVGVGTVRLGVVDLAGRKHRRGGFDYDPGDTADSVLRRVGDSIAVLAGDRGGVGPRRLVGVGVAVPGPVDEAGRGLLMTINLNWRDVGVADVLEAAVGLPVVVEHNVRAMALAEARFGLGRGLGSVAFVYLRTGLGAGLVVAGRGFQGGVHGAVELGHLRVVEGGDRCVCGATGCLETVVSDRALRRVLDALDIDPGEREPLVALVAEADRSDGAAAALDAVVMHIATGLSALMNLLTPEVILLGGAFSQVPDAFVERLTQATRESVFPVIRPAVRLQRSSLPLDGGVDGAATVALDRFFYA